MPLTEGDCPKSGKSIFPTELEAKLALAQIQREKRRNVKHRKECRYYECEHCGGYHLTSRREL